MDRRAVSRDAGKVPVAVAVNKADSGLLAALVPSILRPQGCGALPAASVGTNGISSMTEVAGSPAPCPEHLQDTSRALCLQKEGTPQPPGKLLCGGAGAAACAL